MRTNEGESSANGFFQRWVAYDIVAAALAEAVHELPSSHPKYSAAPTTINGAIRTEYSLPEPRFTTRRTLRAKGKKQPRTISHKSRGGMFDETAQLSSVHRCRRGLGDRGPIDVGRTASSPDKTILESPR